MELKYIRLITKVVNIILNNKIGEENISIFKKVTIFLFKIKINSDCKNNKATTSSPRRNPNIFKPIKLLSKIEEKKNIKNRRITYGNCSFFKFFIDTKNNISYILLSSEVK